MNLKYDVIVIGAGHAGCEAACAAANLGSKTLLMTMDMNKIGQMSCNPAVGGNAKGQIVREIDAMGGYMGIVTDDTAIQFRLLNRSKGPAMWSPRAQSDRMRFIMKWREVIDHTPNLSVWQDTATGFVFDQGQITGVNTAIGMTFTSKTVILTAGTFLNGLMHIGPKQMKGGRIAEPSSYGLTEQLKAMGFTTGRMKTGTPMRVNGRSIDFTKMERQDGEHDFHKFSFLDYQPRQLKQRPCWITFTNPSTHDIIREHLNESPLFNGQIASIGPRYCPSIETKIITFADKDKHQLFIEPEGEDTEEYYINGFSSSLPIETQFKALRSVPGFEHFEAYRPGYAIEYDYFDPTQLTHTLETKRIKNLFFAGQVNGTTGYEEAAGQGMVAGINAHIKVHGGEDFILQRDESYIGVLIDDLVTKGVDEPYRMFTSRAEHRILLRQDNADQRLTQRAYDLGLARADRLQLLQEKIKAIEAITAYCKSTLVKGKDINTFLEAHGSTPLRQSQKLYDLILRPQLNLDSLSTYSPDLKDFIQAQCPTRLEEIQEEVELSIKYRGYIAREQVIADKFHRLDHIVIAGKIDYNTIQSISTEARQKLLRINPDTIGQASRIPGISPNDINVLLVLMGH